MRLSTVIMPIYPWGEAAALWQRAEELGFDTAYTYDHLTWRSFQDHPWFAAIPTLTAAASVTSRMRLGTMVTSPNFRHPVTLAKEVMTLDDVSQGRVTLGIGAGGSGFDATALGQAAWTPAERADHFEEFVALLDTVLTQPQTSVAGTHYSAIDARTIPGCVQRPRVPFAIAATGPRGMATAARFGQTWVTYGDPRDPAGVSSEAAPGIISAQLDRLRAAYDVIGRDPEEIDAVLLQGSTSERPLDSVAQFVEYAGTYQALGITELVIHWPVPDSVYAADLRVFEQIATEGLAQLRS